MHDCPRHKGLNDRALPRLICCGGALIVLGMATVQANEPARQWRVLETFADPQSLEEWDLSQVKGSWRQDGAARLIYPRWQIWRGKWPSARLYLGSADADWTPYSQLEFTVANDAVVPALVSLRLDDAHGKRAVRRFNIPSRDRRVCSVDVASLSRELDVGRMAMFDLFMSQPVATYPLSLDAVQLVSLPVDLTDAELRIDPFGGGEVEAVATFHRRQRWRVRLEDERGRVWDEGRGAGYRMSWRPDASALPPGRFRVIASVTGTTPTTWVTRQLGKFEIEPEATRDRLVVWYEPPTRKVLLESRPTAGQPLAGWRNVSSGRAPLLNLEMARNEEEGVQVVFLSRLEPVDVVVRTQPLRHVETGEQLPDSAVRLFQVGYVHTERPADYPVDHVGWWPDPLLPADSLKAMPGECMAIWTSLRTTVDTAPGVYEGELSVSIGPGEVGSLPLRVRVHAASVPAETTVRTAFSLYDHSLRRLYGGEIPPSVYAKFVDLIADHRLNLDHLYRRTPPDLAVVKRLAAAGKLNAFNIRYVKPEEVRSTAQLQEVAQLLDPYVAELRRLGLVDKAYIYGFDEVQLNQFARLKRVFAFFKARYPDVRTMTTAQDPGYGQITGLSEVVDIWVPLTPVYDQKMATQARAHGIEVWWYLAHTPIHPYANWLVEYTALETRLLWWMTHSLQVDGFLYYAMNRWPEQRELMRRVGGNKTNWNPASFNTNNGAGDLFYANANGPITTIRLENLRDGIEDVELLRQLNDDEAESLIAEVVRSRTDFTRNSEQFARVRRRLLEAVSR